MKRIHESYGKEKRQKQTRKILEYFSFPLLFSPLFFYFILERPEIPEIATVALFCFWCLSFLLDMTSTLSIKDKIKRHEANFLFRVLYTKFKPIVAVTIQIFIEISFVLFLPTISTIREAGQTFEVDWTGSAILCGIVGVLHVVAWHQNKKAIREIMKSE